MMRRLQSVLLALSLALIANGIGDLAAPRASIAQGLDEAVRLTQRGIQLFQQGRYVQAEPLLKRALEIVKKALGPDRPEVAVSLTNLAELYAKQGRYEKAETLYKQSLAIVEKAFGAEHPIVAQSLTRLATLYLSWGRYADAEPRLNRSRAILEKALGRDHAEVAIVLNDLASLYSNQGRYADAERLYKDARAIIEKVLGPDHPEVAVILNGLATLYVYQGRYADAEPLLNHTIAIAKTAFGREHLSFAPYLNNLAELYSRGGRYEDAQRLHKLALAIKEKELGPDHPQVLFEDALLAEAYRQQARYDEAETLLRSSLATAEKTPGLDNQILALLLNNLAELYASQRRYKDAEPLLKHALSLYEEALGPNAPNATMVLNNLAKLYGDQGRYEEALPFVRRYEESLPTVSRSLDPRQDMGASGFAFRILFGAQRAKLISEAESFAESYRVLQASWSSAAAEAVNKLAQRFAASSGELAELVRKDQDLAVEAAGLDKALLAAVSKASNERSAAAEDDIRKRLGEIDAERKRLSATLQERFPAYVALANPQPLTLKETQDLLADDEAVVAFDVGEKTSYAWVVTQTAADWTEIPADRKTLEEKIATLRRGLSLRDIKQAIAVGAKPELFDLDLAHDLYAVLLGPVEGLIKDKKHLVVVPAGPLTALPFDVLATEKPAARVTRIGDIARYRDIAWLVKRQALTTLPSITSLKVLRAIVEGGEAPKALTGYADPVFNEVAARAINQSRERATNQIREYATYYRGSEVDLNALRRLPQLPNTADELRSVAKRLGVPDSEIHLGSAATEAAVKHANLAQYRIIYFATHGLVAGDVKDLAEPALALTLPREATDEDDGLLTASEVAQLKLNADFVVLSACNTAAGDRPGAEALSGLARAFFYAGARALLVSHWSVESGAAVRLTTGTFDALRADPSIGRSEALRRVMIAMINDKSNEWNAYPAFWAPFVVVGEGSSFAGASSP